MTHAMASSSAHGTPAVSTNVGHRAASRRLEPGQSRGLALLPATCSSLLTPVDVCCSDGTFAGAAAPSVASNGFSLGKLMTGVN